jgi:hypothetical protein
MGEHTRVLVARVATCDTTVFVGITPQLAQLLSHILPDTRLADFDRFEHTEKTTL